MPPRAGSKELRGVIRELEERGLRVDVREHIKVFCEARLVAILGGSPSTKRWVPNLERDLRRAGVLGPGERLRR